ncbi:uncharacterized protein LOC127545670 isoform X3 [Antechinus flavipes]|uniref:uncharacterized protein LOC127545670 isoform X3 n=1 Tax=Antechinus flavipes TaxID=38775 RepID=UPI002235610B|nr:uncharacterized protein LOC127545670 isoform X3 [Antechinus flavipes]
MGASSLGPSQGAEGEGTSGRSLGGSSPSFLPAKASQRVRLLGIPGGPSVATPTVSPLSPQVKQCSCRQKPSAEKSLPIQGVSSKSQRTRDPLPVLQVEAVTQAFEQVGLGLVGPLMETANGFRFILLSVDAYSRWVEAAPLKEQNPVEVASALIPFLLRFGRPQLLVTTLRVPFVSQVNRSLHRQLQGLGVPLGKLDIIVSAFQPKINSILSLTASSIRR